MHDFIKSEKFNGIRFPNLKGHVKIELRNEQTGRVETAFEGENMITNALKDIFASNYCGALDYRKCLPLYSKMLGGVILFGNTQDTTSEGAANDYFIPDNANNSVIAHAGQTALSSQADDTTRGNPLDTAMHVADGAVTLAWTWASSAGNGTIKSVSLTHSDVGDAGTGSTSNAFKAMIPYINAGYGLTWTHESNLSDNMIMFVGADGYAYRFTVNTTTVTIYKTPLAYDETGLVASSPFVEIDQTETHNVTTATNFAYNPFYCYVKETNRLWLFYNTSNTNAVSVEEINLSTWIATNHDSSFSNLDESVGALYNRYYSPMPLPYYNGYVYLRKGYATSTSDFKMSTGFLRVQLSSTANQRDYSANVIALGGVLAPSSSGKVLAGKSFVINGNSLFPCSSEDIWAAPNGYSEISQFGFLDQKVGLAGVGGQYLNFNGNYQNYYVAISKFYLATKFNLPEPVTKANNQSMTVIYTLTEV